MKPVKLLWLRRAIALPVLVTLFPILAVATVLKLAANGLALLAKTVLAAVGVAAAVGAPKNGDDRDVG